MRHPNANPASSSLFPQALPSSQSVTLITLDVSLSHSFPSSACSITCLTTLPSSSNSNRNQPWNSLFLSAADRVSPVPVVSHSLNLSIPPLPLALGHVFQRTMSFSPPLLRLLLLVSGFVGEKVEPEGEEQPFLTMRSERTISLTFPRTGTRPHATGDVHSAAV